MFSLSRLDRRVRVAPECDRECHGEGGSARSTAALPARLGAAVGSVDFQLPTILAPIAAPNPISVRRDRPRHITMFPEADHWRARGIRLTWRS